jgi:acyl-CoA thioester hydrolase
MNIVHHSTLERVRYADTDKMGIVYNAQYLRFFEIGRTEMLRAHGLPYPSLEEQGFMLPVLEAHVVYKQPARYDDLLRIHAAYTIEHRPTIHIRYSIELEGHSHAPVVATGFTLHTFVQAATFKPCKPPGHFFRTLEQYLDKNE